MNSNSRRSQKNQNTFKPTQLSKALAAVLIAGVFGGASGTAYAAPDKPWKEGQILVKPKAGLSDIEFDKILKRNKGQKKGIIGNIGVHVISVPPQAEQAVIRALSKNPHVEFAELDMAVELSLTTPNDPRYGNQWHLPKIQAPTSWSATKADNTVIAILDTGVDSAHSDLSSKMLPGWNAVDGSTNSSDVHGHGTAVAGTAAATTDNANGVAGVAWNAQILPVRITNSSDGWAYWSDIARGLNWAADQGADVANISYGVSNSSTVTNAAQYMRSKNGLVVVAAGNDGIDPGFKNNIYMISVSATTSSDDKASWSNYGEFIDVAAPGTSIQTTTRGGGYGNWNGTSFSSPVTAGVVALIQGANPTLTPDEVEQILKSSADKIAGNIHPYYGHGRVNAATAVEMALNMVNVTVDNEAPSVNIFSPTGGSTVSGLIAVEVSATDNVGVSEVSLYANGLYVGTDTTAPYQFSWDSKEIADGSVTLSATAIDAAGNEGVSSDVNVTVKNTIEEVEEVADEPVEEVIEDMAAPTVAISNPADGSRVSRVVKINVSAEDDVAVANIQLFINGSLASSADGNQLSHNWNTNRESRGTYIIEAVATDTSNKTAKHTITVSK
ncbi:S8 family serine peptidase [Methylotuvimicrobium alcaliphilum]|uniref:Peptidase S8 and S53 subtilisin kexin sedolisin n=1 Tax=Methylotuvimicrobium alcaliphilum (strain DSM 19304 / NCIMB 14124 / VKM B-2133 / 20Z) TaxID=1091494 RepID=G4SZP5_META2|nr:S8 family serine peptidase [Methylotuvimicrobium alcaliphilum]CCE24486.1 Peptidase S8 and S53 subtilisin kexin sedolisin [Methylotuvimicrobium alcaliphilum 20Z]